MPPPAIRGRPARHPRPVDPPAGRRRPPARGQDASLRIGRGETLCIVGESGSGKSMIANAVMGLLPQPMVAPVAGAIVFQGHDLLALAEPQWRALRQPHRHDLPGSDVGAQSGDAHRRPARRGAGRAPAPVARRQARPHPGAARRAAAGSRGHRRQLSRTPVRRPAPARHDRLRADAGAGAADRRRAHHRAGRHHPGADPGADPRSAGQARHRRAVHHP